MALSGDGKPRGAPYYELCDGGTIGFNCPNASNDGSTVVVVTTATTGDSENALVPSGRLLNRHLQRAAIALGHPSWNANLDPVWFVAPGSYGQPAVCPMLTRKPYVYVRTVLQKR